MKRLLPLFPNLVCVLMFLAFASDASAQDYPRTISVQGYLEDPVTGLPVSDEKCTLIIRIYDDSTGNNKLYESPEIEAFLYKGIFNVEIGPLDNVFIDSITGPGYAQREYYVGIIVETEPELTPRTKLTASPYALSVDSKAAVTKLEFKGVNTMTMSGYVVVEPGTGISFAPGTGPNSVKISAVVDAILTGSVLDAKTWRLGGNTSPDTNIFGTLDTTTINMQTNGSAAIIIDGTTQDVNILKNLDVDDTLKVDDYTIHVGTLDQRGGILNTAGDVVINDSANVMGSLNVDTNLNVNSNTTLNGNVDLGDAAADAVTLNGTLTGAGNGHSLGMVSTDTNVLTIKGDPNNVGDYELFVDGDVQITGLLSLPGLSASSVVVTDGAGNLITDNPPLAYDATTDVMMAPDIVPSANNTHSLGTDGTRWADVYVNGGSVHIGDAGGEAGNAEMNLGYSVNSATINVDGGNAEWEMDAGAGIFRWDPNADGTSNMLLNSSLLSLNTGVGSDLFIAEDQIFVLSTVDETLTFTNTSTGDLDINVIGDVDIDNDLNIDGNTTHVGTLDQQGSVLNTTGNVVINDDANVIGSLDVGSNVKVVGLLSLPSLSPNSVVVTDGSSNIAVETIDNLFSGSTLSEDALLVGDAANNPAELAVGVVDQVLQVNASGSPQWQTINFLPTGTVNNSMLVWDNTPNEWVENTMLIADPVTGSLDIVGPTTLATYSGGGNQSLYVDNSGTIQASNGAAGQNATGVFNGTQAVAVAVVVQVVAETNVVAGSVIQVTFESVAGPANSFYINGITTGVGFTVNFATPPAVGDVIHYTVSNP